MSTFSSFATDIYNNQKKYKSQGRFCALMLSSCGSEFFKENICNNESSENYAKKLLNGSKQLNSSIRELKDNTFQFETARQFFDEILNEQNDETFNKLATTFLNNEPTKSKELFVLALVNTLEQYMIQTTNDIPTKVCDEYQKLMKQDKLIPCIPSPDDFELILESNCKCPITRRKLIQNGKKEYVIVRIFPPSLDKKTEQLFNAFSKKPKNIDDKNNLIALSTSVAYGYLKAPSFEMFEKLVDIKKKNKDGIDLEERCDNIDVEQNLTNLLNALTKINNFDALERLSLEALKINEKIPESTPGTYDQVKTLALRYYNFIDTYLSQLENELIEDDSTIDGKSTRLGKGIKALSKEYSKAGVPIPEHIERLSHKLLDKVEYSIDSIDIAKIIVAYFIQHCEVLSDETAK